MPRLYDDLASWWPLLSRPSDYAEEAAIYGNALADACRGPAKTLLELGCGGGNNASHLKSRFVVTLSDPSPGMLAVSRELNPACEHVQGDMRTLRLERAFDCVLIHDAICYMTTMDDLDAALETAYLHCRPGGAALFAPDFTTETFRPGTGHGGHDGPTTGLRYLEWSWDPDPDDGTYVVDYAYLLRGPDGKVDVVHDRHVEGLFGRDDWLEAISRAGFEARAVPFVHSELDAAGEFFVASRPGD